MDIKDALGIAGAVTAAIGLVPPLVGMFKSSPSTSPSITIVGDSAAVNTGSGTINQTNVIDKSNKTFVSNYVETWVAGYMIMSGQQPQEHRQMPVPQSGPPATQGVPVPVQLPDGAGPVKGSGQRQGSSDDPRVPAILAMNQEGMNKSPRESPSQDPIFGPRFARCVLACLPNDKGGCIVQTANGSKIEVTAPVHFQDCSSLYLNQGSIEGVSWSPRARRFWAIEASPGTTIGTNDIVGGADFEALDNPCLFSPTPCGKTVPRKKPVPGTRLIGNSDDADYDAVLDAADRREFERADLGMIAALLRKGYYWDAAHFRELKRQ